MASYNLIAIFFSLTVLLFTATSARDQLAFTYNMESLTVSGRVCCTANGTCRPLRSPALSGAIVVLSCADTSNAFINIGSANIDATGNFVISPIGLTNIPSFPPDCRVKVTLPTNAAVCSLLSTATGFLQAPVEPILKSISSINGRIINEAVTAVTGFWTRA